MVFHILLFIYFFFFKQKTAYEMRISDWSSDVCSSDLCSLSAMAAGPILVVGDSLSAAHNIPQDQGWVALLQDRLNQRATPAPEEIGRASCRERVCPYV